MLMVIEERVIGPACLPAGSLMRKATLGRAEQINPKRKETKKRVSKQEQMMMLSVEQRNSNMLDLDIPKYVKYAHTTRSSRDRAS